MMGYALRPANFRRMYRNDALATQDHQCCYCFATLTRKTATFEHVVPRSKGGCVSRENGKASCLKCNQLKGDMSQTAFKLMIKHPKQGSAWAVWRAWSRRRIGLAANRACRNIARAAK